MSIAIDFRFPTMLDTCLQEPRWQQINQDITKTYTISNHEILIYMTCKNFRILKFQTFYFQRQFLDPFAYSVYIVLFRVV